MKRIACCGVMGLVMMASGTAGWCQFRGASSGDGMSFRDACFRSPMTPEPRFQMLEVKRQRACAYQLVRRMAERDGLYAYVASQEVQLEPNYRIRVFFRFKRDMRGVLKKLGTFWKFPNWLGGGRYASSCGRGQPGFEIHLDHNASSATVDLDARKSSDVDEHEPAGDLGSVVMHAVNVIQHKAGKREKAPCEMLADLPSEDSIIAAKK